MNVQTEKKRSVKGHQSPKVEATVEDGSMIIRLSTWVEGLGWVCQKTIPMEPSQVDDFHRTVAAARCRLRASEEGTSGDRPNVLEFPAMI